MLINLIILIFGNYNGDALILKYFFNNDVKLIPNF